MRNSTHSGPFPVTSPQPPPSRLGSWVESNFPGPTDFQGGSVQARAAEAGGAGGTRRARSGQGYSHFSLVAHPSRLASSRKTENRYCDPTTSPGCFPSPETTGPGGAPVPFSQGKEGVLGQMSPASTTLPPIPTPTPQMPGPGFLPSPQRRLPGVGRRRSLPGGTGCCRVGGGVCIWNGGGSTSGGLRPGVGPGRGAQRRRFGEPGLSSAASNSMGRFNVAPHAMPLTGQGPGAYVVEAPVQPPAPQRSSQAKPAPMAPPAPGSGSGPASCDVTDLITVRRGGSRKRATLCSPSATVRHAAPPSEEMEWPRRRIWSPSNQGWAPASAPPSVPFPPPLSHRSRVAP